MNNTKSIEDMVKICNKGNWISRRRGEKEGGSNCAWGDDGRERIPHEDTKLSIPWSVWVENWITTNKTVCIHLRVKPLKFKGKIFKIGEVKKSRLP